MHIYPVYISLSVAHLTLVEPNFELAQSCLELALVKTARLVVSEIGVGSMSVYSVSGSFRNHRGPFPRIHFSGFRRRTPYSFLTSRTLIRRCHRETPEGVSLSVMHCDGAVGRVLGGLQGLVGGTIPESAPSSQRHRHACRLLSRGSLCAPRPRVVEMSF